MRASWFRNVVLFVSLVGMLSPVWGGDLPLRFAEEGRFSLGVEDASAVAMDRADRVYVACREGVAVFDLSGKRIRTHKTEARATAVVVDEDGTIYVALKTRIVKVSREGKVLAQWGKDGKGEREFGYVTSLAVRGAVLYVADAGNRRLIRYAVNGDFVDARGGYQAPSPYFDCAVTERGGLVLADPGNHRVIRYDANMEKVGEWGSFGGQPEQFVGCCNPCAIAAWPDGRVATAEKGAPRVKVYSGEGNLLALLGTDAFPFASGGMDLAVDSKGRLIVMEPGRGELRIYRIGDAPGGKKGEGR